MCKPSYISPSVEMYYSYFSGVTRLVLRRYDRPSSRPVLQIVREGENHGMKGRNKKEGMEQVNTAEQSIKERITSFSTLLTPKNVTKWVSSGLCEARKKHKKT